MTGMAKELLSMEPVEVGKMLYRCPIKGCCKTSDRKYNIKMHLRRHTKEKPFYCSYAGCTMSYGWKSSLNQHEKYHERDGDMKKANIEATLSQCPPLHSMTASLATSSRVQSLVSGSPSGSGISQMTVERDYEDTCSAAMDEKEQFYCEVLFVGAAEPDVGDLFRCSHPHCGRLFNSEKDLETHSLEHTRRQYSDASVKTFSCVPCL